MVLTRPKIHLHDGKTTAVHIQRLIGWHWTISLSWQVCHPRILFQSVISLISTAVKRVFLQGRQLLHFIRNRLGPSTISSFLCRLDLPAMEDLLASGSKTEAKRSRS
ncbi:hypothetical protein BDR03DRAFT_128986 [Suillus americanus]|nr:hypothetical protein BDR03DRAFT_128986 [Suillus americanus]